MTAKADSFVHTKANIECGDTVNMLTKAFEKLIKRNPVFVCIGTDRCAGDSFGPLVGTFLEQKGFRVIGTVKNPCHAVNLNDRLTEIPENSFVVAIDSSLGERVSVGDISIRNGKLIPGAGVGKTLPHVGDVAIKGVVNFSLDNVQLDLITLQNTRLGFVWEMAEITAEAIARAVPLVNTEREVAAVSA